MFGGWASHGQNSGNGYFMIAKIVDTCFGTGNRLSPICGTKITGKENKFIFSERKLFSPMDS